MRLFSVGHGNREAPALVAVLRAHGIATLCDVRAFPSSRRWPHFDRAALQATLQDAGIAYHWLGRELGGYRKGARRRSPHVALEGMWRAYADHMEGEAFHAGVTRLLELGRAAPTAFLCAERDWRPCHRRHIADHLVALAGATVLHIQDEGAPHAHALDPRARVLDGHLVYDRGLQPPLF